MWGRSSPGCRGSIPGSCRQIQPDTRARGREKAGKEVSAQPTDSGNGWHPPAGQDPLDGAATGLATPPPHSRSAPRVTAGLLLPHLCPLLPHPPPSPAGSEPPCPVLAGIFPGMSSGFGLVGCVPAGHQLRGCRGRSSGTETWKTLLSCCQPFPACSQGESPCLGSRITSLGLKGSDSPCPCDSFPFSSFLADTRLLISSSARLGTTPGSPQPTLAAQRKTTTQAHHSTESFTHGGNAAQKRDSGSAAELNKPELIVLLVMGSGADTTQCRTGRQQIQP